MKDDRIRPGFTSWRNCFDIVNWVTGEHQVYKISIPLILKHSLAEEAEGRKLRRNWLTEFVWLASVKTGGYFVCSGFTLIAWQPVVKKFQSRNFFETAVLNWSNSKRLGSESIHRLLHRYEQRSQCMLNDIINYLCQCRQHTVRAIFICFLACYLKNCGWFS